MAKQNCSALVSSFRDMDDSLPLVPMPSSGIKSVVNLEEAVKSRSSGPCKSSGVCPLAIGVEQSRIMQLPDCVK